MNSDNLVGITLGNRYDMLEKIGTGGMATVYKAKDTLLNRYVAIKILRDSLEGEEQVVSNFIKRLSHRQVWYTIILCLFMMSAKRAVLIIWLWNTSTALHLKNT